AVTRLNRRDSPTVSMTFGMVSSRATNGFRPVAANGRKNVLQGQTRSTGVHNQAFCVFVEDESTDRGAGGMGRAAHHRTDAWAYNQHATLDERRNDLVCRVRVDFQFLAERAN